MTAPLIGSSLVCWRRQAWRYMPGPVRLHLSTQYPRISTSGAASSLDVALATCKPHPILARYEDPNNDVCFVSCTRRHTTGGIRIGFLHILAPWCCRYASQPGFVASQLFVSTWVEKKRPCSSAIPSLCGLVGIPLPRKASAACLGCSSKTVWCGSSGRPW